MPTSSNNVLSSTNFVTAILVSHNGALWLPEVVAALSKQTRAIDQIIAVDTGSEDGSVKLLKNAGLNPLSIPRTSGFGDAIDYALNHPKTRRADEGATEWIWLIHDDCSPASTALESLLEAIEDRPNVAMVGPKLRGWHDRNHLLEVGVSIAGNGARWTGLEFREQDQGQRDEISEVMSVSTAGALIRREMYDEIGGIDLSLGMFRDDVDLGWRLHTAGHSVIVAPKAIAYHAEAAANERRAIDLSDAFLHRPLLLDRRNAAYVLLANSSFWLLPIIALQLLGSSLLRAGGFLLAKRPGYALDELGAVALLILKPGTLLAARQNRRKYRLVSSRVVARFVPPRGSQFFLAVERVIGAISRSWRNSSLYRPQQQGASALDLNDEALESADLVETNSISPIKAIARRPILSSTVVVVFAAILAFRGRFGALVGGALPSTPSSGLDLLRTYVESWHTVGLGSSATMPPWIALLGITSFITLGNAQLLISLIFITAIPLAFLGAYRLARKFTELPFLALAAALMYSFSPVAIASVNSGRLASTILLALGPWLMRALLRLEQLENVSWRRTWWLSLLLTVVCALSPLTFLVILIWQFILFVTDTVSFNSKPELSKEIFDARNSRRIVLLIAPLAALAPWSIEFIIHPSRILLDPGLAIPGGSTLSVLLGNPGGLGSPPLWILSPVLIIALVALFVSKTSRLAEVSLFFVGAAAIFGSQNVIGHGVFKESRLWVGSLLIIPTLAAILAAVVIVDRYVPEISEEHIGYRHILLGAISALATFSVLMSLGWWISTSGSAPLQSGKKSALPAFLSASAQTIERYKTLVIRKDAGEIRYFIARDRDLQLGDPDITVGLVPSVENAIVDLVTGVGTDSSQVFAEFGIRYIFLAAPTDQTLTRTIDSVGGFSRASSTDEGITWKVKGALGHVAFLSSTGEYSSLPSGDVGAVGKVSSQGTIIVTEKYQDRWKLIINGKVIQPTETSNGTVRFAVDSPGDFILYHDGTSRRAWVSYQLIAFVLLIIAALPARRRRREMREEEVA